MFKYLTLFLMTFSGCESEKYDNPHVVINTDLGEIEVEIFTDKAPQTSEAFLTNIDKGLYKNSTFYRVLKSDDVASNVNTGLIQGGLYAAGKQQHIKGTPHETTKRSGLTHTDGTISMARTDPGSATTEFFICIGDQSPLDSGRRGTPDGLGMAAFGKVFKGMKVVRMIQAQESNGDAFQRKIVIKNIKRT